MNQGNGCQRMPLPPQVLRVLIWHHEVSYGQSTRLKITNNFQIFTSHLIWKIHNDLNTWIVSIIGSPRNFKWYACILSYMEIDNANSSIWTIRKNRKITCGSKLYDAHQKFQFTSMEMEYIHHRTKCSRPKLHATVYIYEKRRIEKDNHLLVKQRNKRNVCIKILNAGVIHAIKQFLIP